MGQDINERRLDAERRTEEMAEAEPLRLDNEAHDLRVRSEIGLLLRIDRIRGRLLADATGRQYALRGIQTARSEGRKRSKRQAVGMRLPVLPAADGHHRHANALRELALREPELCPQAPDPLSGANAIRFSHHPPGRFTDFTNYNTTSRAPSPPSGLSLSPQR